MREGLKILHVARRYGPVGGMERYVWEVTRELAALGHQVEVVCERCHAEPPPGIAVYELGEIAARPRWLALLRFGTRVARWLEAHPRPDAVIHSHERLNSHHVTTFHGPPFATVRDKPWWKKLSLRIAMQLWLERRELRVARAIVPNSAIIAKMLAHYYPEYAHKLTKPVEPGVAAGPLREFRAVDPQGGVIGFVGKEWQRKGLPLIADVVAELRRTRPHLELQVVGPAPEEVQHLFAGWQGGYRLLGWRSDNDYLRDFDVLLHPARAEPYGMAIAEAMAARVPVVVSDICGAAASVGAESGAVLPLSAPVGDWANAIETQLRRAEAPPRFDRGWRAVAAEYETIYKNLNGEKQ
jgi:UDP-glucose:(heptosyl)LPS alpha-1,3-glucosyltransferase